MRKLGVKKSILYTLIVMLTIAFSCLIVFVLSSKKNTNNKHLDHKVQVDAWSGDGTSSSPYLIQSKSDLQTLSDLIYDGYGFYNKYFMLTTDLDYEGEEFSPIGSKIESGIYKGYYNFGGNFDGGGHTISNISVTVTSASFEQEKVGLNGWANRDIWDFHKVPHIGLFAYVGSYNNKYYANGDYLWDWGYGKYVYTESSDITSTIKNIQVVNFTVSNSVSEAFIGGIAGRVDTNYFDASYSEYDCSMSVEITACAVDNFNVTQCGSNSYVAGIVGAFETSYSDYEYIEPIKINNCIVKGFSSTGNHKILTVLTPSYSVLVDSQAITRTAYLSGSDHCRFAYAYTMRYCVTDNMVYHTINNYLLDFYASNVEADLVNDDPIEYYTGDDCELEDIDGSVGYDGLGVKYNSLWYYSESSRMGYLKQFVVDMSIIVNNSSWGYLTFSEDFILEELTEYGYLKLPKWSLSVSGNNLNIWNLWTVTPTAKNGYKFVNWETTLTSAKAIFEPLVEILTISFAGNDNTSEWSANVELNKTYSVNKGTILYISFKQYAKGAGYYYSCTFTFTDSSETKRTIIYSTEPSSKYDGSSNWTETHNTHYISKSTLGTVDYTINKSQHNINVVANLKNYKPSFL